MVAPHHSCYSFAQAAKILNCTEDEVFHFAAFEGLQAAIFLTDDIVDVEGRPTSGSFSVLCKLDVMVVRQLQSNICVERNATALLASIPFPGVPGKSYADEALERVPLPEGGWTYNNFPKHKDVKITREMLVFLPEDVAEFQRQSDLKRAIAQAGWAISNAGKSEEGNGGFSATANLSPTHSAVDWLFWLSMGKAKDWEACALSLGIDPASLKRHPQGWMAGPDAGPVFTSASFAPQGLQERFEKRLRLLRANRFDRAKFSLPMAPNSNLGPGEILLTEFATWALSVGWGDIPPELAEFSKRHDASGAPGLQRVAPVVTSEEWSELEDREEAARKDPEYRAASDRAAHLYAERDQLLEYARQGLPAPPQVKERLSEIRLELADHEARVDAVAARFQERGKDESERIPVDSSTSIEAGETSGDSHIRLLPNGGDSLTPMIWEICYNLRDAGQKVTPKPVMAELKMRAEKRIHPLVGNVLGGVAYEYDKGEETELDAEQLRGRIKEWRKKTGN